MKNKMYLQLFEDGAEAGSGAQGGSTGTGNGSQGGNAGGASGAHGTGTYTYEQLEEIANARVERSERTALANFFRNQGMTETEVTQAIADFKAQKAANQPNVSQLQSDLEAANRENERLKNEKLLTQKGVKADDLDYVAFKVSKMVDEKTDFAKATDKFKRIHVLSEAHPAERTGSVPVRRQEEARAQETRTMILMLRSEEQQEGR